MYLNPVIQGRRQNQIIGNVIYIDNLRKLLQTLRSRISGREAYKE
jgi:hypothetical protein